MLLRRRPVAVLGALLALGMLSACAPGPEPTPSPTLLFASDEEAFAAAEEVYRAYNDALNEVNFTNPHSFEPVFELLTGEISASTRESFSAFHSDGVVVTGSTRYFGFEAKEVANERQTVNATVCVDVTEVAVVTADGTTLVTPERPPIQMMSVSFEVVHSALLISKLEPHAESACE